MWAWLCFKKIALLVKLHNDNVTEGEGISQRTATSQSSELILNQVFSICTVC